MRQRRIGLLAVLGILSASALQAGEKKVEDLFLPAFEYQSRTSAEWLDAFVRSGGEDSDALFCVFYWDDRSEPVLAALRSCLLAPGTSAGARRNIETVLSHWQVEYELPPALPPPPQPAPRDGMYYPSRRPFVPPLPLLEGDDPSLLALLRQAEDPLRRARAAITLVCRQRHVEEVIPLLVRAVFDQTKGTWRGQVFSRSNGEVPETEALGHALIFCMDFAGSAADQALAGLLGDEQSEEALVLFVLRQVGSSSVALPEVYLPVLPDLAARTGKTGRWALRRALLLGLGQRWSRYFADLTDQANRWAVGSRSQDDPPTPEAGMLMARVTAAFLSAALQGSVQFDPRDAWLFLEPGLRDETVRGEVIAGLLPFLDRDGDDVFRVLCHLGADAPEMKERYLQVLEAWSDLSGEGLERLPCLHQHDQETLSALTALFERAEEKRPFLWPLAAAGLLDDEMSDLGRRTLAAMDAHHPHGWWDVHRLGCRCAPEVHPTDDPAVQVNKLALAIRTLRDRGQDATAQASRLMALLSENEEPQGDFGYSDPFVLGAARIAELGIATSEFLDWAVEYLLHQNTYHFAEVADMVACFPLNRRQQAILCHATEDDPFGEQSRVGLLAVQGVVSIECADWIREHLERSFNLEIIDLLLDITRPTAAERDLLARAITGGIAGDRARALHIVEKHGVDAAEIVAAVTHAQADCDACVRRAAGKALRALGR